MYSRHTKPILLQTIIHLIQTWKNDTEKDTDWMATLDNDLRRCVKYQSYIGWNNFVRGIMYHGWHDYQNDNKPAQNNDWLTPLIKQFLEHGRKIWNERCTIVKVENQATHEQRQRRAAWDLCNTYALCTFIA